MTDEDEKTKRSYIRRAFKESEGAKTEDEAVNEAEIEDGAVEVEEAESNEPVRFLGEEPVSDSIKAKIVKKLGLNKTMVFKPWKKLDHWECSSCGWTTFDRQRAKRHACD